MTSETKPERTGTEYVVLKASTAVEGNFEKIGVVYAGNDTAAIARLNAGNPDAGKYVAIPKRSFREREVTVQSVTQTRVA